jgi:hypothetical protein
MHEHIPSLQRDLINKMREMRETVMILVPIKILKHFYFIQSLEELNRDWPTVTVAMRMVFVLFMKAFTRPTMCKAAVPLCHHPKRATCVLHIFTGFLLFNRTYLFFLTHALNLL